jgi:hypothetical protein
MKNFIIVLSALILVAASSLAVQAQPIPGVYDSRLIPFDPGSWQEILPDGFEGQPGNIIRAQDTYYSFGYLDDQEVQLQQVFELSSPELPGKPYFKYQTLYNGGLLWLVNDGNAPWSNGDDPADDFVATLGIVKVITKKFVDAGSGQPTDEIAFILKAKAEFGLYPGFKAYITAKFERAIPDSTDPIDDTVIMSGDLSWVRIKIVGPEPDLTIAVDIKPGSCPNPLNIKSKGVLPVAILGSEDFDVKEIKKNSIKLMGVKSLRWSYEDVATPFEPYTDKDDAYDCNELGDDGFLDLTLKFKRTEIVEKIKKKYGGVDRDQAVVLKLKGKLKDGTPFYGEDVIIIKKPGKKK